MPTLIPRILSGRPTALARDRHIEAPSPATGFGVTSADGEALPLQVDGDFLGYVESAAFESHPRSLAVVS